MTTGRHNCRVLVIEDHAGVAISLKYWLEMHGLHDILFARDADGAEALLLDLPFDVVIADHSLGIGQRTGLDVFRAVEKWYATKWVFYTGDTHRLPSMMAVPATVPVIDKLDHEGLWAAIRAILDAQTRHAAAQLADAAASGRECLEELSEKADV